MNEELVANRVSFEEDDAMAVFAFCADEGQSAEYLMFQYPLQTDEQDRLLGLDGLYIERDDQAFGCYRGVDSIRRIGDRIEIDLNAEGKRRLKVERMDGRSRCGHHPASQARAAPARVSGPEPRDRYELRDDRHRRKPF